MKPLGFKQPAFDVALKRAREIAHDVLAPNAEAVDRDGHWPQEGMRALQAAGLGGLTVPEVYGGMGQSLLALTKVCEALGSECASTAICFGMHSVGASVIAANATPYHAERYLVPICAGRHTTTLALSEPGTGSHFYLPQVRLQATGAQSYRISGTKTFVTNGGYADSYVVSAVTEDPNAEAGEFSCVVVSKEAEGFRCGPAWAGIGMRGNSSRTIDFSEVFVPRADLLGKEGDHIWYIFNVVTPYFLVAMAGTYLGVASAALEEGKRHLLKRYHSHRGSTLAQLPVLQHRLGYLWGVLERTRQLAYHAAQGFDLHETDALVAVMSSKAEVADCVTTLVSEVMTLCGGIGYRDGSKLHRLLRDGRAAHLMSPTTDILRIWIGRALLGQPLLAE